MANQNSEIKFDLRPALDEEYLDGFNIRTLWGALFVGFVMLPGAIYLGLMTGQNIATAAPWVTAILFIELAKRSFVTLSRQEILILYMVASSVFAIEIAFASGAPLFGGPIGAKVWDQYYVQSPQAEGLGIAQHIPRWVVPPKTSEAITNRSFFHHDWLLPLGILLLSLMLLRINRLSLGYALFRVTSDIERLPFPMAPVTSEGVFALAETSAKKESWRWRAFSIGSMIGALYGLVYIGVPTLSNILLNRTIMLLPIPWIDLTSKTSSILPAVATGIWTDLTYLFTGMVLPFSVVLGTFTGVIVGKVIGNPILYSQGILHSWHPGMATVPTVLSNLLDFWLSISIGLAVVVGVVGIFSVIKAMVRLRSKKENAVSGLKPPPGRTDIPITAAFGIWAVSTLGFVILCHYLAPRFPLWILLIFGFLWTPFTSYVSSRMIGLTGSATGASFPYLREGVTILSGYRGINIWFAPMPLFDHSAVVQNFKILELTKTKFVSYIKMMVLVFFIMFISSLLFWTLIWKLAPIPSPAYPFVERMWPIYATIQSLWISSTQAGGSSAHWIAQALNVKYILAGFGAGSVLYAAVALLGAPVGFFYGIVGGVSFSTWMHHALPMLIGALLGRYYFGKKFGQKRWKSYAPILAAGYGCGMGLVAMVLIGFALIAKAVSPLVF